MSRIGKQPVVIPQTVKVSVQEKTLLVEGPKGKLSLSLPDGIKITIDGGLATATRASDDKQSKSIHGTIRALLNNMVKGVVEGYKKELDVVGTGFKAQAKGTSLSLTLGFSHPVEIPAPSGIKISTPNPNRIILEGIDKQVVSEFAAKIRQIYIPEPYKGKGIRFVGEEVKKKLGKALAK